MNDLVFAVRGSFGFALKRGLTFPDDIIAENLDPKNDICRSMKFSNTGKYFCYCDSKRTVVINSNNGKELFSAELGKTQQIEFSPNDNILMTYEPYVIYGTRMNADGTQKIPNPNLRFWSIPNRKLLATLISKKQSIWKPQFSEDESVVLRLEGSEIQMYENFNFERYTKKAVIKDLESFSLSPGIPHIMCFIPPLKGQAATLELRIVDIESGTLPIKYTKKSFNCDKCIMMWNPRGTACLITTSVDVDKSDKSYYGVSHLLCVLVSKVLDSFQVQLDKQGPLHSVEWSPNGREFCVCYGFMPSKVSIFNVRGDKIYDFPEGHRNEIHYNPFGNILVICGFGNISSGKMLFWNVEERNEIVTFEVPHTTHFEWAPDGEHFSTSTTAPRLRIGNNYRIWHYAYRLKYDANHEKEELWQVSWMPAKNFTKPTIIKLNQQDKLSIASRIITSNAPIAPTDKLPTGAINKQGAYVPPHMRKGGAGVTTNSTNNNSNSNNKPVLSETEKEIKKLQKKLDDIKKLKEKQKAGLTLELNQLEKIQNETILLNELETLNLRVA